MRIDCGDKDRDATMKENEVDSLSRFRSSGSDAAISCAPFECCSIDLPDTTDVAPRLSAFSGNGPIWAMVAQLVYAEGWRAEDSTSVPTYDSSSLN